MKKIMFLGAALAVSAFAWAQWGPPVFSENLLAAPASVVSDSQFTDGYLRVLASAYADPIYPDENYPADLVTIRYSRDFLYDSNFEEGTGGAAGTGERGSEEYGQIIRDVWNSDTELYDAWQQYEDGSVTIEQEETNELYGDTSVRFEGSGVTALGTNMALDTVTVHDFTGWTEAGTITAETTIEHTAAGTAARLEALSDSAGGEQPDADLTSDLISVSGSTDYILTVWGRLGAVGDVLDIRIYDAANQDYYTTSDAWSSSESDLCNDQFEVDAWNQCIIVFTTQATTSVLQVSAHVDVEGDIAYVDDFALCAVDTTFIQARGRYTLSRTSVETGYILGFDYAGEGTDSVLQYAIIDSSTTATPYYWNGDSDGWTTTETWNSVDSAVVATNAEQELVYFYANTNSTLPHTFQVRFRMAGAGTSEDIYLDRVFVVEAAGPDDLPVNIDQPVFFEVKHPGRVVAYALTSTTVNAAQLR